MRGRAAPRCDRPVPRAGRGPLLGRDRWHAGARLSADQTDRAAHAAERGGLMRRLAIMLLAAVAATGFTSSRADAHGMRTAYVEVAENSPGHALVHLRV